MKVKQLLYIISSHEKRQVKQVELAEMLGYSKQHFSEMNTANKDIPATKLKIIEEKYNINLSNEIDERYSAAHAECAELLGTSFSQMDEIVKFAYEHRERLVALIKILSEKPDALDAALVAVLNFQKQK
jgi:plasmid maintenance system antidote protein VapI